MNIQIADNQKEWDSWFFLQKQHNFLQSFEWGEFQKSTGKGVLRLQILDGDSILAQVQGFVHNLGLGMKYVYVPRIKNYETRIMDLVFEYFKEKKYIFVRLEPVEEIQNSKFKIQNTKNRQPQHTLVLNIEKPKEELLEEMHSKTRYNIRLADRKGIVVKREKNIDIFWKLNEETTGRDKFKSHDKNYYAGMLETDMCYQLVAYYEDAPVASNLFIKFGSTFTYLHGTSSNKYRNLMAPYLLQWKGIQFAQELECSFYDFWGIAPPVEESSNTKSTCFHNLCWKIDDPWTGITRFKVGFGGDSTSYPEAMEIPLNFWKYKLYSLVKKLRK